MFSMLFYINWCHCFLYFNPASLSAMAVPCDSLLTLNTRSLPNSRGTIFVLNNLVKLFTNFHCKYFTKFYQIIFDFILVPYQNWKLDYYKFSVFYGCSWNVLQPALVLLYFFKVEILSINKLPTTVKAQQMSMNVLTNFIQNTNNEMFVFWTIIIVTLFIL